MTSVTRVSLLLAYLAFISLGLPDSLLGVGWPSVSADLRVPLDAVGLLLVAGTETTTNVIANGLVALSAHPEAKYALCADPSEIPAAVEEILRYDGPVPAVVKVCTEESVLGDRRIRPGEMVFPFLSSANRDPAQFLDPERLDITRRPNRHLAFGYGIHFCLGAPLARLESEIAATRLAERLPRIRLKGGEPEWHDSLILRGVKSLPVAL